MKPFKPEHYFDAAVQRLAQAHILYEQGTSYSLSMYTAGLAVECMLRAFKGRKTRTVDEKHDLRKLFVSSGMAVIDPADWPANAPSIDRFVLELRSVLNMVAILWSNDLRYASEERALAQLRKDAALRAGIKGDILKANARKLLNAAQVFIDKGTLRWRLATKPGGS